MLWLGEANPRGPFASVTLCRSPGALKSQLSRAPRFSLMFGREKKKLLTSTDEPDFSATVGPDAVRFSTTDADLTIGGSTVRVLPDGRYAVHAAAPAEDGAGAVTVDLVVTPQPRAYFPGATMESGDFASGYAVAGLRADIQRMLQDNAGDPRFTKVTKERA